MKAIHLTAYGNPAQNLQMVEVPEPNAPSTGEALVRMEYAPVDDSDLLLANGVYFLNPQLPSVIGGEGAGIVEAIGPGGANVKVGDRVTIPFRTSTWAEKVLAPTDGLFVVPPSIDARTASMLNINPTTAVLLLDGFVKLKPKDWIVLNAANSQVARCIIAIAKSRALNVAGIVRRSELIQELERLGVDFVGVESPELPKQIQSATGGMPISLGLDAVGGPAAATIAGALSPGAHFVSYAWLGGLPIYLPQGDLIGKQLNIRGFWMYYEEFLPKIREVVVAGDAAYNDVHIHLGESNADSRKEWIAALDMIETLKPRAVVAGHKRPGRPDAPEIVGETRQYIHDFDRIAANTQTAKELYDQMLAIYPDRVNPAVLWNSARAVKG